MPARRLSETTSPMSSRNLDRFGVPGWIQALPFGLVFAAFFVVPLSWS